MTVKELVATKYATKLWLCPNIVSDQRFVSEPLLCGIECSRSCIPEGISDKNVIKSWSESGMLCIIWENEPFCSTWRPNTNLS